jgi:hypothetical protein
VLGRNAFETRKHQAHKMQSRKLPVGNATEFVFLIGRGVVESVSPKESDFKGDVANLFRSHGFEALEGIEVLDDNFVAFNLN